MIPKILNVGSGKDFREDAINIDINPIFKPDVVMDISQPDLAVSHLPPFHALTERFGAVEFKRGSFDRIIAKDVLEHIPDLVTAMTNCRDLLRMEGEMEIVVPYDLSVGAWSDPTHVRAFNERSWIYYAEWAWYLGWEDTCLMCVKNELQVIPAFKDKNISVEEVTRIPRAVESIKVILKKVKYVKPETLR